MPPTLLFLAETPAVSAEPALPPPVVYQQALLVIAAGTVGGVLGYLLGLGATPAPRRDPAGWVREITLNLLGGVDLTKERVRTLSVGAGVTF